MSAAYTRPQDRVPRILLIYTGGTIGMIEDSVSGALRPFDFSHLIDNVPKLEKLGYDIENISFEPPIDSSDMNPTRWKEIAQLIAERYNGYDGFVLLHGTDTMAYTASALSFMLEGLRKPVIITGSQLPIGEVRTDGEENLITAVQIAAATDTSGMPLVQAVAILFEDYLWRGNRATKMSADNFNAFKSNNFSPLAKIGLDIHFNPDALYRPAPGVPFSPRYNLDTGVMFVDLFPGLRISTLNHLLSTPGIKGIVMRTYGAGNAPTNDDFIDAIRSAVDNGLVIVNVTQCVNGGVNTRYEAGDKLASAGVTSGRDSTAEAAITKMMYLFGQGLSPEAVRYQFDLPLRGEIS